MTLNLKIEAIIFLILSILFIFYLVKKDKIAVKYSLIWLIPFSILLIFVIIPPFLKFITELLGFQTASNMVMIALIVFLLLISLVLTIIVSNQKEQIRILIEEVSLLKKDKNE